MTLAELDLTFVRQGLAGVLPPALISGATLVLAWRPWRPRGSNELGLGPGTAWGAPLALGLGYAAGDVAIHGAWPPWSLSLGVKQALFYVAIVLSLIGLIQALGNRLHLVVRAVLAFASPWFLLDFVRQFTWETGEAVGWTIAFAFGILAAWTGLDALARRRTGTTIPLVLMCVSVLTSGALQVSGSASLAQLSGALAAPLGTCVLVAWRAPGFSLAEGGAAVFVFLHAGLCLAGHYASELPASSALLAFAAPLLAWVTELPQLKSRPLARTLTALVLVLVPLGVALWLASEALPKNPYY